MLTGTMGTTIEGAFDFHAVTDDLTPAVRTFGRQRMDGTFKTVKDMHFASHAHFKTFIVFVSADLTSAEIVISLKEVWGGVCNCIHANSY
jgi:hypothetical protein